MYNAISYLHLLKHQLPPPRGRYHCNNRVITFMTWYVSLRWIKFPSSTWRQQEKLKSSSCPEKWRRQPRSAHTHTHTHTHAHSHARTHTRAVCSVKLVNQTFTTFRKWKQRSRVELWLQSQALSTQHTSMHSTILCFWIFKYFIREFPTVFFLFPCTENLESCIYVCFSWNWMPSREWCPFLPAADGRKMSGKLKQNPAECASWRQNTSEAFRGQKMGILDRLCPRCPLLHTQLCPDTHTITTKCPYFFRQAACSQDRLYFRGLAENCWYTIVQHVGHHGESKTLHCKGLITPESGTMKFHRTS